MADKTDETNQPEAEKNLPTWQEKMDGGQALSNLEETKADADFNYRQRLREQQEREAFEKRKQGLQEQRDNQKKGNK